MNHDVNQNASLFERISHLYAMCDTQLDKFILLFSFVKMAIIQGKTVIMCNDVVQAYRIKLFFNRFSLKSFVLAPDMPKNQIGSIIHFFHIGQFDIVVMLHSGYTNRPMLKDVSTVLNFDMPATYNLYKEASQLVGDDYGSVLTLLSPKEKEQMQQFENLQKKMVRNFAREDMLKCIPILWSELNKLKSRVETVVRTLNNKTVMNEKVIEFKK